MKILLHSCCGPCASACVPRLKREGDEVIMFFANSNIDTREEFLRRLAAARTVAEAEGVELVALEYDHDEWLREVAAGYEAEPEKGTRCARCFAYNLAKTAAKCRELGLDGFATTLTVSPHKISAMVFAAAPQPSTLSPVFLAYDFKKKDGFKESLKRSAELGLYRQSYCGCEFSRREAAK